MSYRRSDVPRTLQSTLSRLAKQFPALAILGPRQSGKTTLAKMLFPTYRYVNLESFEERDLLRLSSSDDVYDHYALPPNAYFGRDKANLIYGSLENQKRSGIQGTSWRLI